MEQQQITSASLNTFLDNRQKEILALAHKNTEEIVKTEMALLEFELLLEAHSNNEETGKLSNVSRELRIESWHELSTRFNDDYDKINDFIEKF